MLDVLYDKTRTEQINRGESEPKERKKIMDDNNKTSRMNNKVKRQRKRKISNAHQAQKGCEHSRLNLLLIVFIIMCPLFSFSFFTSPNNSSSNNK